MSEMSLAQTTVILRVIIGDKYNTHVHLVFATPDSGAITLSGVHHGGANYARLIDLVQQQNPSQIDLKETQKQRYITYYAAFEYRFAFADMGSDLTHFINSKFNHVKVSPPIRGNKPPSLTTPLPG